MYIMTVDWRIINIDDFHYIHIREHDDFENESQKERTYDLYAVGGGSIKDQCIYRKVSWDQAQDILWNLFDALEKGDPVWNVFDAWEEIDNSPE